MRSRPFTDLALELIIVIQALLLHRYQLQEERVRTEDVDEPQQEELGGRTYTEGLQQSLQVRPTPRSR